MGLFPRMTMFNTVDGASANPVCARYSGESLIVTKMNPYFADFLCGKLCLMVICSMRLTLTPTVSYFAKRAMISAFIGSSANRPIFVMRIKAFSLPVFSNHVIRVVLMGSKPKMLRVYAGRIVTRMADKQPSRNSTRSEHKGKPMSLIATLLSVWKTNIKLAVSLGIFACFPTPATDFRFGILSMKPRNNIFINHSKISVLVNNTIPEMGGIV